MWEHFYEDKPPLASTPVKFDVTASAPFVTVTTAAAAIRTAIASNSNTGISAASALSARIASHRSAGKGKGKFDARAASKVDQIVFEYLDYLDVSSAKDLALTVATDHMYLARITRVLGGTQMDILTQDNIPERARIPGHLRARGSVSHKRHKTHVFGVGDVVIIEYGDIKGKFDSPALLALMEARFTSIGYTVPAGFFSGTKDSTTHAEELSRSDEAAWEFDYSEEADRLLKKRSLDPVGGAGADDDRIDIDAI